MYNRKHTFFMSVLMKVDKKCDTHVSQAWSELKGRCAGTIVTVEHTRILLWKETTDMRKCWGKNQP